MNINRLSADRTDTIFALASGAGRAAVAIVRLSGPQVEAALAEIAPGGEIPPRRAVLRRLVHPVSGEPLEKGLVLRFPAPASFTGETMAELQVTGGRAVVRGVLDALASLKGLRPAEPGEFAWRAFLNGKLDLSAVEGLADLVEAETAAQRRQAARLAGGELAAFADAIRLDLVEASATLEAQIDFSDVEDAEALTLAEARTTLGRAADRLRAALKGAEAARRIRDGFTVVIAGPPNAGKSTLMNVLARRDVAIVSPVPGTTRDAIEVFLELGGLPVTLIDTAGLRETEDAIEREGVRRTQARLRSADLTLWLTPAEEGSAVNARDRLAVETGRVLQVTTKADRLAGRLRAEGLVVSARTGEGMESLLAAIAEAAGEGSTGEASLIAHERHRAAFAEALAALERALDSRQSEAELIAEDVRLAGRALQRIAGRVDVEDVLDRIFSRLCVGK